MNVNVKDFIKKITLVIVGLIIVSLLSSLVFGFFLGLGGNIKMIGFNKVAFDPLITIAYMMLFYFMSMFYQPDAKKQFYLFLLVLFMSFAVSFIQGAIFIVILYVVFRKFKLI